MADIYEQAINDGFGFINLGRHLGLYYAPRSQMGNCPKGWMFIASEDNLSSTQIKEMCKEYMEGICH
jgi:hypothetical protein